MNEFSTKTTASESTFVALLAGRTMAITRYKAQYPELEDAEINSRLVGYCSDQVIYYIHQVYIEQSFSDGLYKIRLIALWRKLD